jgi:hypothetical protein
MNHISKSFDAGGGKVLKCHSWELREGGYRRTAIVVGNGLWSIAKEERLIRFLLERGFRVLSPELAYGSAAAPRMGLPAFREAVLAFAKAEATSGLPLYLIASSASAGALLPAASTLPDIAAVALLAPIVGFPPPGAHRRPFFLPRFELALTPDSLSGERELLEGLMPAHAALRFRSRDCRAAGADLAACARIDRLFPVAAFAGDDDPFLSQADRAFIQSAKIKAYGYPRARHEPGRDRYADNYYADLGSFLDEVEAAMGRSKTAGDFQ